MRSNRLEVDGFVISVNIGTLKAPPETMGVTLMWFPPDDLLRSGGPGKDVSGECSVFFSHCLAGWPRCVEKLNAVLHKGVEQPKGFESQMQTAKGNQITKTVVVTIEEVA